MKHSSPILRFSSIVTVCLGLMLLSSGCQSTAFLGPKHRDAVKTLVDHMPPERLEKIVKEGEHDALAMGLYESKDKDTLIPEPLSEHFLIDLAKEESWDGCHEALDTLLTDSTKNQWLASQKLFRSGLLKNLSALTGKSYTKKFEPFKGIKLFKKKEGSKKDDTSTTEDSSTEAEEESTPPEAETQMGAEPTE